jgi:hypothetical protein
LRDTPIAFEHPVSATTAEALEAIAVADDGGRLLKYESPQKVN